MVVVGNDDFQKVVVAGRFVVVVVWDCLENVSAFFVVEFGRFVVVVTALIAAFNWDPFLSLEFQEFEIFDD